MQVAGPGPNFQPAMARGTRFLGRPLIRASKETGREKASPFPSDCHEAAESCLLLWGI